MEPTGGQASQLVYRIDAADRIERMGRSCPGENDGGVATEFVGRSLWDVIGDLTTETLYRQMVRAARQGRTVRFRYRCDTPEARRLFRMVIAGAGAGAVDFTTSLIREEPRPPVALLDPARGPRSADLVRICSWCERAALPDGSWVPIEEAVVAMGVLEKAVIPRLTHGVCPSCARRVLRELERLSRPGAPPSRPAGAP